MTWRECRRDFSEGSARYYPPTVGRQRHQAHRARTREAAVYPARPRSRSHETASPSTSPQNGAPICRIGTSATVTRKQISAPKLKRPPKEAVNAVCRTRSIARPASVAMNAGGVASSSRVKNGARTPNATAKRQKNRAPVYWRCVSPALESTALTGPVRHVETAPSSPVTTDPAPQATVIALTGAGWPLAARMATPCAFCTASTVMASGTTSSTVAAHENSGTYRFGAASVNSAAAGGLNAPRTPMASAPAIRAPMSGGSTLESLGRAARRANAAVIGRAIHGWSRKASTRSTPKRRNTPATIAITIGIGTASIARRTQPDRPSRSISTPVARNAPTTSANARWPSAGPTSTAPGMLHRKTSGCRYASVKAIEITLFRQNAAKIQEAMSDSARPPRAPTARMIATGPLAANRNATIAATAYGAPAAARMLRGPGGGETILSSGMRGGILG